MAESKYLWFKKLPRLARVILAGCFVVLITMTETVAASLGQTPTESVKSTLAELIQILDNKELYQPHRSEERRYQIQQALSARFSYQDMAKLSLGSAWRELDDRQRQEFADLFLQFLANSLASWRFEQESLAKSINEHPDEVIIYLSEQLKDSFSEVRTRVQGLKVDTLLDFRLVHQSGKWRVYDVVIDKVSLAGNYHAQFASIARFFSFAEIENRIRNILPILKLLEKVSPR